MTERSQQQTRTLVFDVDARTAADGEAIPVVVSTESVVEVRDGPEILLHSADAVDLSRAPLPIIATHGRGQLNVGIVYNLQVANGQMRGLAKFGERPEAAGYRADVLNRIIRSISVGYARIRGKVREDGVLVTTRWMPYHAAMVAEPADPNAGFFRADEAFEIEAEAPAQAGSQTAQPAEPRGAAMTTEVREAPAAPTVVTEEQAQQPVEYEKQRKTAIQNLVRANKLDERIGHRWIASGAGMDRVSEDLLKILKEREESESQAFVDLDRKEIRSYSLMRAVRALASGDRKDAGLEFEASEAIAKKLNRIGRTDKSFFVPLEIQARPLNQRMLQRDATVGGSAGYLVATENVGFIELLRNRMVAYQMGATRLSGLVGNVTIPKQTVGATAYWLATETTSVTEGNQTFVQVGLTPNTVAAYTQVSRLLQLQSSPDIDTLVMSDLSKQVAIAADLAIIAGTGTEQPTGITQTGSIGTVTGTSFTYPTILEFQSDVATANALSGSLGYVTTPAVAAMAMSRPTFTNGVVPIWTGSMLDGMMGGFKAMSSMQVPTAGMLFGDWSSVVVGEWGVLEIAVNPNDVFAQGLTGIRAMYTMDVAVRYAGAWSWGAAMT